MPGNEDHRLVAKHAAGTDLEGYVGRNFTKAGRADRKDMFIEAIRIKGTIRFACRVSGVTRETFYYWREHDQEFARRLADALEDYNDKLREEIDRRGEQGVVKEKRVYYKGELVDAYEEREYSDSLLMFQARARMPEYRDEPVARDAGEKIPLAALRRILSEPETSGLAGPSGPVYEAEYTVKDQDEDKVKDESSQ